MELLSASVMIQILMPLAITYADSRRVPSINARSFAHVSLAPTTPQSLAVWRSRYGRRPPHIPTATRRADPAL